MLNRKAPSTNSVVARDTQVENWVTIRLGVYASGAGRDVRGVCARGRVKKADVSMSMSMGLCMGMGMCMGMGTPRRPLGINMGMLRHLWVWHEHGHGHGYSWPKGRN